MQKFGQSLTEIKNQIVRKIIEDTEIIKALIIPEKDFLTVTPTPEQQSVLDNPDLLIRQQIMLTKNVTAITIKDMPYITSAYVNFIKKDTFFQRGKVYFYIIIPNHLEETLFGVRYDYIGDKLEEIFSDFGIGKFEFSERGDLIVDENFLGHYISFNITDFGRW